MEKTNKFIYVDLSGIPNYMGSPNKFVLLKKNLIYVFEVQRKIKVLFGLNIDISFMIGDFVVNPYEYVDILQESDTLPRVVPSKTNIDPETVLRNVHQELASLAQNANEYIPLIDRISVERTSTSVRSSCDIASHFESIDISHQSEKEGGQQKSFEQNIEKDSFPTSEIVDAGNELVRKRKRVRKHKSKKKQEEILTDPALPPYTPAIVGQRKHIRFEANEASDLESPEQDIPKVPQFVRRRPSTRTKTFAIGSLLNELRSEVSAEKVTEEIQSAVNFNGSSEKAWSTSTPAETNQSQQSFKDCSSIETETPAIFCSDGLEQLLSLRKTFGNPPVFVRNGTIST